MTLSIKTFRHKQYTDPEVVRGLQAHDRQVEEWFYAASQRYFNAHFNDVFFDKDRRQEVFQSAFLKLWTEIENGRIGLRTLSGGDAPVVTRQMADGTYRPMTCALTTFLIAFARNEYREIVRNIHEDYYDALVEADCMPASLPSDGDENEQRLRIVDECIHQMSPHCVELLTLFFVEGLSLDEVMQRRPENSSKDGLKTAKNKCLTSLRKKVEEAMRKKAHSL